MTGYTNTLFPIRWYLEHFFLFFTMKKERNAPKERKTRAAEFFCRKIPVIETSPRPSPSWGGGSPQGLHNLAILRLMHTRHVERSETSQGLTVEETPSYCDSSAIASE